MRDSDLEQEVARLERELAALKAGQRSGSDVIVVHETTTANPVDFQITSPGYATVIRWVKFVADNQAEPLVRVLCDVTYDSGGAHPLDETSTITYTQIPDRPDSEVVIRIEAEVPTDIKWSKFPPPAPTGTMNFKVYANATDTGVITIHTSLP